MDSRATRITSGHFRRELLPPPQAFYAEELGKLGRPSRGWAAPKAGCPFHKSDSKTSFRVNLQTGAWICFAGCGKGDIVKFVRQRYGLDFKRACIKLGAWAAVVTDADRRAIAEQERKREQERAEEAAKQEAARRERIAARDWLHLLERTYDETAERLSELRKGAEEAVPAEEERLWEILALGVEAIREAEAEYYRLAGVAIE